MDRIDLLQQAARKFRSRGLVVHTINSRESFARDIKSTSAIHNDSGRPEITVVNIQKFQDDPNVIRTIDYNLTLQRVYFLDEVHRSYNPQGSFLANLSESDTGAIKIGLTGTPLLGDYPSKALFGDYILTRANRPYKAFRYGYVVDFADIEAEFEKTNKAYFAELQSELGDEIKHYSDLFKSPEEITAEIDAIKDALFHFDTNNAENFSRQISEIRDSKQMREIVKALNDARCLYNEIRSTGRYELLEKLHFRKLTMLATEANNHLALLNQRDALENGQDVTNLLNIALEDVLFTFRKVSEAELVIADQHYDTLRRTREGLAGNFDQRDPQFVSLREELERLFRKKNLSEITQQEMASNITILNGIHARARELERKNQLIRAKYANDAKYARLHKRLMEKGEPTPNERKLFEALSSLKTEVDARISGNAQLLTNPPYAEHMMARMIIEQLGNKHELPLTPEGCRFINNLVIREYIAPEECAIGRGLSALRSKSGSSSFLFQVLQNFQQIFARRNGDGTTFGSINRDDLRSSQLAYPSEVELVRFFDRIVSETDALIFANHQQNQELAALRDWLLPMLMNGQVRVG